MPLEVRNEWYCPSCKRVLTERQKTCDNRCALCHHPVNLHSVHATLNFNREDVNEWTPPRVLLLEKEYLEGLLREVLRFHTLTAGFPAGVSRRRLLFPEDLVRRIEAALKGGDSGNAEGGD